MLKLVIQGWLYQYIVKPLIFYFLPPDRAHTLFIRIGIFLQACLLTRWLVRQCFWLEPHTMLHQEIDGIQFTHPIGLSAGFDKDGEVYRLMGDVGFAFTQVGSLTALPYGGNPPPRVMRLPKSKSLVINYGLKNDGIHTIGPRLMRRGTTKIPVSVSIAKTNCSATADEAIAIHDYAETLRYLEEQQLGDMYTINISCPNTFDGEPFTTPVRLHALLEEIVPLQCSVPVWLKMPIDMDDATFLSLIDVAVDHGVRGLVIGNLRKDRSGVVEKDAIQDMPGGISGSYTREMSNQKIALAYTYCPERMTIVGVGGIFAPEDVYEKIRCGAHLVQLITGMIYQGPQLISQLHLGLTHLLQRDGYTHISQARGTLVE